MISPETLSPWKRWIKPNRLIPLLTILGAGLSIVLSLLGIIKLNIAENIIIALLALLAVDALTERLSVLEKIEARLSKLTAEQSLKKRSEILTPIEHGPQASEICIAVIHGGSVITPYTGFYESRIRDGCKIRVILLDPGAEAVQTWILRSRGTDSKLRIEASLERLRSLVQLSGVKGNCEVRLSNVFLPYSIFAVDLAENSGSMIVEYHSYKRSIDDRPHIHLTALDSLYWFNYYKQQFEQVWSEAIPWQP